MGFALVHDTLFTHPLFIGKPFTSREAWLWIIMNAMRDKGEFRSGCEVYPIPRGCLGTRYRALAREFKWSVNRVIRELKTYQNCLMIDLKTEHGFVLIRVCNFDKYQQPSKVNGTVTEQQRNSNGTATDTKLTGKQETGNKDSGNLVPEDFLETVAKLGIKVNLQEEIESCIDWHKSKGTKVKCWKATFRTWLRNKKKWDNEKKVVGVYDWTKH